MAIGSKGEYVSHVAAVRMRIKGYGVLDMELNSLDDINTQTLIGFQMQEATNIQPTRLANFNEQRFRLVGSVDTIEEWFNISTIILFHKVIALSYPSIHDAVPTS